MNFNVGVRYDCWWLVVVVDGLIEVGVGVGCIVSFLSLGVVNFLVVLFEVVRVVY